MKDVINLYFQVKDPSEPRPYDVSDSEFPITLPLGAPIPDVGDSVSYPSSGKIVVRKVVSRNFTFSEQQDSYVSFTVEEMSDKEINARMKD